MPAGTRTVVLDPGHGGTSAAGASSPNNATGPNGLLEKDLTLDLVADFSLINTKTYEVKAAFSATGSGQDTKILTRAGDHVVMNRGKVISETSKSLAESAYAELMSQFGVPRSGAVRTGPALNNATTSGQPAPVQKVGPVTVY